MDHLVFGVPDLEQGIDLVERKTGVRADSAASIRVAARTTRSSRSATGSTSRSLRSIPSNPQPPR